MKIMTNSLLPNDYYQTILEIKERINEARFKSFRAVNTEMILMYLEIGKVISIKVSRGWGNSVVDKLSIDLQAEYPGVKGFSSRNLRRMKQIYEQCGENEIWPQLVAKLPWGQTGLIFSKFKQEDEISFYLQTCVERGWSRSVLEEEIRFDAFSKWQLFQNNFPKTIQENQLVEYRLEFRDEYDLSFLELEDIHTERQLENAMVLNITKTLGRFGADFAFMGRQFRLELDDKDYFVDLLFYHRKLKCMIAIELKAQEFKPEHSQQLSWYLHLLDKTVKYDDDKPSIGILLCKSKSTITVEYALEMLNQPMGVATYTYTQLPAEIAQYLPNEIDLKQLMQDEE
jgi:predicted nuclease of restriction endonuclease-like (RecB) superfamily